ncbi:MAG: hypothetical protein BM557_10130 [Flavobacterium sp. MedPE-SWcel]|uniref:DUF6929 family protein n=1 Tax=uncultured Flavobacterium sp. TaxID=165435 RepID=UPI00090F7776|nr:hypothetical protein [uncultured Flavobacterium sp.]OIQ16219.1 MAG: hypothetical protein BM557_10130 [Flavobacterium sp. MedPE-SWcel]
MQKFQLQLLFQIIGIGSASGLLLDNDSLFIVSDNSHLLYEYNIKTEQLNKTPLVADDYTGLLENIPKEHKADYEAVTINNNDLYLFGSGSTEKRSSIGRINIDTKEALPHLDATDLYLIMQSFGGINPEGFNIEGAINDGTTWYLLQRGNGKSEQNGIFTLEGDISEMFFQIIYNPIELPRIDSVQAGFTDGIKVNDKLYFLASVEKSSSAHNDSKTAGTYIGILNLETMKVESTMLIGQNNYKGITLYKDNNSTLEFLLCEDKGDNEMISNIYKITIDK